MPNPKPSPSSAEQVTSLLYEMARDRNAQPSPERLAKDAMRLSAEFPLEAIRRGIAVIVSSERREGETAYPEWVRLWWAVKRGAMTLARKPRCNRCDSHRWVVVGEGIKSWVVPCPSCNSAPLSEDRKTMGVGQ